MVFKIECIRQNPTMVSKASKKYLRQASKEKIKKRCPQGVTCVNLRLQNNDDKVKREWERDPQWLHKCIPK